jgi:phosphate acetyltransferase
MCCSSAMFATSFCSATQVISRNASQLGLKLDRATLISPPDSEYREPFAKRYQELRAKKNPTFELAYDLMHDPTYFGTMMVQEGQAHGMVSGSINTTAHTLRPALEFIKTTEGVSIASSVFFMCLPNQVLVYGDCAVNPNPTAEQLADIAIASAETAAAFEVEPYVAMISYSTGASGKGSDVEKVRAATDLVKKRNPTLKVEGPIQYDAAIDKSVAKTKLPNSECRWRRDGLYLPRPQHGQYNLQGCAAFGQRHRRRPGDAGAQKAGQRSQSRLYHCRYHQHGRHHGDSSPTRLASNSKLSKMLIVRCLFL